jgi:enterochelin esterase-like enzyme
MTAFQRELFDDAIPLVETLYRVEKDSAKRAIAGLSMGGGQSLSTGLGDVGRFGWIGAFSSAPPTQGVIDQAIEDSAGTNKALRLLWIACGKDDFLLKRNEEFIAKLKDKGVKHEWLLTDGDHSWPVWRRYLADFAPLIFRDK